MTSKLKPPARILGDSFAAEANKVYVYRDKGNGRPDGSYLKVYDPGPKGVEKEQLERDLGPGTYVLFAKIGGTLQKESVLIPGEIRSNEDETPDDLSNKHLARILEKKMILEQFHKKEPDALELIRTFGEFIRPQQSQGIEHFYEGVNFGTESAGSGPEFSPEEMLTRWGLSQVDQSKRQNELKQLVAFMRKGFATIAGKITRIDAKIENLEQQIEEMTIDAGEIPEDEDARKGKDPMELISILFELPDEVAVDSHKILNYLEFADRATEGALRAEMRKLRGRGLDEYIEASLLSKNRGQFKEQYTEAAHLFTE